MSWGASIACETQYKLTRRSLRLRCTALLILYIVISRFFINEIKSKIMIEYLNRYSETDLPDDMGRWARQAVYRNIRIAWISRLEVKDKVVFSVSCYFPTLQNDTANEHKVFMTLQEAKEFVSERWNWFLNAVS